MAVQSHAISFVQGLGDVWLYPFWEWSRWLMDIVSCLLLYPRSSNYKDWRHCRCALKMLPFNWPADGGCGCIEIYKKISLGYFAVWRQQPHPDDFIGSITSFRSDGRKKMLIMAIRLLEPKKRIMQIVQLLDQKWFTSEAVVLKLHWPLTRRILFQNTKIAKVKTTVH